MTPLLTTPSLLLAELCSGDDALVDAATSEYLLRARYIIERGPAGWRLTYGVPA